MTKYTLEFEAPDDLRPIRESGCWVNCPLQNMIPLSTTCKAREMYDDHGYITCPIIRLTTKEKKGE